MTNCERSIKYMVCRVYRIYILCSSVENRLVFQRYTLKDPYMHVFMRSLERFLSNTNILKILNMQLHLANHISFLYLPSATCVHCIITRRIAYMYRLTGILLSDCTSLRSQKVFMTFSRKQSLFESRMKILHVFTVVLVFLALHGVFYTYNVCN